MIVVNRYTQQEVTYLEKANNTVAALYLQCCYFSDDDTVLIFANWTDDHWLRFITAISQSL